jgi:drug/metabolite transporter (DMT)-like permease
MNPGSSGAAAGAALVPVVVLGAAVLHAVWNALAHGMKDQLVGFALINVAISGCSVILVAVAPLPNAEAWPFILGSTAVHVGYQLMLLRSYGLGDFAQMYPIARGTSPLLVAVWATAVLAQPITAEELVGVLVISAGLMGLALSAGLPGRTQLPAVAAALATGVLIAAYTVIDGSGVRQSDSVLGYIAWLFLLQSPVLIVMAVAVRGRSLFTGLGRRVWFQGLGGGVLSLIAYGLVVWAQARGNLATIAALRETSIVIAALIGAVFFHERFGRFRMVASAVVVAGIAVLELAPT